MIRPAPPPVAVGDHAMVRPDAPKHYGANLGYTQGEVVGIPWLCKRPDSSVDDTRTCVLVQFATTDVYMFPLSELSVIPNLEARRGESV